jgi:hypothetical protein
MELFIEVYVSNPDVNMKRLAVSAMAELFLLPKNTEIEVSKEDNAFFKACQWMTQEKDVQILMHLVRIVNFVARSVPSMGEHLIKTDLHLTIIKLCRSETLKFPNIETNSKGEFHLGTSTFNILSCVASCVGTLALNPKNRKILRDAGALEHLEKAKKVASNVSLERELEDIIKWVKM